MNTSDTTILKQFQTVLNRKYLSEKVFADLLHKWGLDDIDLDEEMQKINEKKSCLSRSRRDAVPEFIKLRDLLKERQEAESNAISFTNDEGSSLYQDTIINN